MKFRSLNLTCSALLLCAVAGCVSSGNRPEDNIGGEFLRNALRGLAAGRAYDRALLAQGRDDDAAYVQATTRLRDSGSLSAAKWADQLTLERAENSVIQGFTLDTLAMSQPSEARAKWENRAMENYRRALTFSPDFPSQNAQLLNALGYSLADRGESDADFKKAEQLTRASLEKMKKQIAKAQNGSLLGAANLRELQYSAASGPHDSLAWALFKQKRYDEALKEQTRAVADAKANQPSGLLAGGGEALPDLLYHLGAIYAAMGQNEKARATFDEALKINPDHGETKTARAKL